MDLVNEINDLTKLLEAKIRELAVVCREYADAYTAYRVLLAQTLVKLKKEGMAATIAYDIARGDGEVASAKNEEIYKEGIYMACRESINAIKLEIKIKQEQYNKEWAQAKNE